MQFTSIVDIDSRHQLEKNTRIYVVKNEREKLAYGCEVVIQFERFV